jgi:cytochrome c-type biogenesis protein
MTANLMTSSSSSRWGRFISTLWFGLGFATSFILMGLGISALLAFFPLAKVVFIILSAVILGVFGLKMAGFLDQKNRSSIFNRSLQMPSFIKKLPGGMHGFFFGSAFGFSWTPCVGPILGGVLTYVASQERSLDEGILLLGTFSLGIVLPLLGVALGTDYFRSKLRRFSRFTPRIETLAGYGLLLFSVVMLKDAFLSWPTSSTAPSIATNSASAESAVPARTSKMFFFYTDSCPVCYRMKNFLPEFEAECTSDNFQFVRVDVGDPANAALASQFNVRVVPTVSVMNPDGDEVLHLLGYQSKVALRQAAEAVTTQSCSAS